MTVFRHLMFVGVLTGLMCAPAVSAIPISPSERAQAFAQCAGRYSAMANHITEASSETFETVRERKALFDMMLEAVLPAAVAYGMPKAQATTWKFDAWRNHAAILNDANYSVDHRRAQNARAASEKMIAECRRLILS
ncbi:MAG: hypothetical protein AAF700_08870 [Pseudomonadota bacterium]